MSKGKKFDAAERHFLEKKKQLDKVVRDANETARKAVEYASDMKKENARLTEENTQLKQQLDFLLSKSNLTSEELRHHIDAQKSVEAGLGILLGIGRYST